MHAQGITKKEYVQADVQKAFAESMGKMGSGSGGGGSSPATDMVGLMAGMKAAGMMMGQMDGMFGCVSQNGISQPVLQATQPKGDMASFKESVEKLIFARDNQLIDEEEFIQRKNQLLSENGL